MNKLYMILIILIGLASPSVFAEEAKPQVKLATSMGDIVVELDRLAAPGTVDNFLGYVRSGQFDGTIFHRVIQGFMIQGGGFDSTMRQRPTAPPIVNEAENGLSNRTGTIAMARTPDPHSATAQFFINVKDNAFLDHQAKTDKGWGYCVFGRVVSGMNVVRAIEHVPTTIRNRMRDVPVTPVVIHAATLVERTKKTATVE